jgi:paraquat-inducible protein A
MHLSLSNAKSWATTSIVLAILMVLGAYAYRSAVTFEKQSREIAKLSETGKKANTIVKRWVENLTVGLYDGYSSDQAEIDDLIKDREEIETRTKSFTISFYLILIVWLVFAFFFYSQQRIFLLSIIFTSILCLIIGIFTPILMLVSTGNFPVIGRTVLQFESRGIIDTIIRLFKSGNFIVGVLILLFSVLIPITKTIVMFMVSLKEPPKAYSWVKIIKDIGKWSMADVMIVALLLAFFALDGEQMTRARLQVGVYFFAGYVILSMVASHFISHEPRRKNQLKGIEI